MKKERVISKSILLFVILIIAFQNNFSTIALPNMNLDEPNDIKGIKHVNSYPASYWQSATNMSIDDAGFSHEYNGSIYFIGSKAVQMFNTTTKQWTIKLNGGLGYQAYRGSSTIIDDRIYYVSRDQFVYYDIASNSFGNLSLNKEVMLDSAAASIGDVIYVSGGWDSYNGNISATTDFKAYFLSNNTWKILEPMQVPRKSHSMVAHDGFIFAISGENASDWYTRTKTIERYNPIKNEWTLLQDLPTGLDSFASVVTNDNRIVVTTLTTTYLYNITQNIWYAGPSFNNSMLYYYNPSLAYYSGFIYLFGFRDAPGNYYNLSFKAVIDINIINDKEIPVITGPADLVISNLSLSYSLEWNVSDLYPNIYSILKNGTIVDFDYWSNNSNISYTLPALYKGSYNFTLIVQDINGNTANDTVIVVSEVIFTNPDTQPTTTPTVPQSYTNTTLTSSDSSITPITQSLSFSFGLFGIAPLIMILLLKKRRND